LVFSQISSQLPASGFQRLAAARRFVQLSRRIAEAPTHLRGGSMQDYRNLQVWQKAHKLTMATYAVSARFRTPEAWPLRDQMLREVISIPSNIAEGSGRGSDPDFRRFLWHSLGSCNELEYDLFLARDLELLPAATHARLAEQVQEVRRMLTGLVQRITGR
jgi:four helix bundle protein